MQFLNRNKKNVYRCRSYLILKVISHKMWGASQWDLAHRPGGIVGQVGGEDTDPQLSLIKKSIHQNQLGNGYSSYW